MTCRDALKIAKHRSDPVPLAIHGARWIPLGRGRFVLVDAADYDWLVSEGPWFANKPRRGFFYAAKMPYLGIENGRPKVGKLVTLHALIAGRYCAHKNGNTLDCRRSNLRKATMGQNNANRVKHSNKIRNLSSNYKGVCRPKDYKKWVTMITLNDRTVRIGTFATELEAAKAYDVAARKNFGRFACVNFPRKGERGALAPEGET